MPYIDAGGQPVSPTTENALKFELFIFDVLPLAERWLVVETPREEEFAPLKNATGADSPGDGEAGDLATWPAGWLEQAGVKVPRDADGNATVPLEISPLFALDADGAGGTGLARASGRSADVFRVGWSSALAARPTATANGGSRANPLTLPTGT